MVAQIETIRKTLYIYLKLNTTRKKEAGQESTIVLQAQTFKVLIRVEGQKRRFQKTKHLHQLNNNRQTIPNIIYSRGRNTLKQLSNLKTSRLTSTLKTNIRRTIATAVTTKVPSKLNYRTNATKQYNCRTKTTKSNNRRTIALTKIPNTSVHL